MTDYEKIEQKKEKKLNKIDKKLSKAEKKREYVQLHEDEINEGIFKKNTNIKKNEPPKRSVLEEIGNAVTHGVGAVLAILALVLLIIKSDTTNKMVASIIYGISMIFMMLMSCLYHSFKSGSKVKRIWRRFDYTSIYLLIGGTFAPMLLVFFYEYHPILSLVIFILDWVIIITGLTIVCVFGPGRVKVLHFTLYILLGWCGVIFLPKLITNNTELFFYILGGGIVYTIGIIPFALNKKSAHFIWHFFVLGGAIVQFIGIYLCLYL